MSIFLCAWYISLIFAWEVFVLIQKFTPDYINMFSPIEINLFYFQEKSNKPWEQSALQNPGWRNSPGRQGQTFPEHRKTPTVGVALLGGVCREGKQGLYITVHFEQSIVSVLEWRVWFPNNDLNDLKHSKTVFCYNSSWHIIGVQ